VQDHLELHPLQWVASYWLLRKGLWQVRLGF
jgi:hypothetical protein